jgi:hypothetical protein
MLPGVADQQACSMHVGFIHRAVTPTIGRFREELLTPGRAPSRDHRLDVRTPLGPDAIDFRVAPTFVQPVLSLPRLDEVAWRLDRNFQARSLRRLKQSTTVFSGDVIGVHTPSP